MSSTRSEWKVESSMASKQAFNPIREIVDKLKLNPTLEKSLISLSIGDPTIFGNFKVDSSVNESIIAKIKEYNANGYPPAHGYLKTREAVAKYTTRPEAPLTSDDVILSSGASGALEMCFNVLCNAGTNILLPCPGFSFYGTLAASKFIEPRYYNLLPEKSWEADLEHLESLIDEKTSAILVNNPSNPCGSNYSAEHLKAILAIAEKHHVPIISDEIYMDLVFTGETCYPMATLTKTVPILAVSGLAKKWLVPGWRFGWITIHDHNNVLKDVRTGLQQLAQVILGPNSLIQAAIPDILENTPESFYKDTIKQLEDNVNLSMELLGKIDGLVPIKPQGAMYMMVGIELEKFSGFKDDVEFSAKLLDEENVVCLPGECFGYPNYIRLVITAPLDRLEEAYTRIEDFCGRCRK